MQHLQYRLRGLLFGKPLATAVQLEHRLPVLLALPVFASDALSSVAYATEEVLKVLAPVTLVNGLWAGGYQLWLSLAITLLMVIVATSYMRAVHLYPHSGGSYTVAKSNLGAYMGLVAAAALLIDYILTVAVSVSSGVEALLSAFATLAPLKIELSLILIAFITLINLRGVKESGWLFALPAYSFIVLIGVLIASSVWHFIAGGGHVPQLGHTPGLPLPTDAVTPTAARGLFLFVLLRAFSNGCSAMTGVEAVSNGVSAFQPPEARNAARTLLVLVITLAILFLGVGFAAHIYGAIPSANETETLISQIARANFGHSFLYYAIQTATLFILIIAANTSFADFPRLLAFVAKDGFAPKGFFTQGDRLVYHRGIITLALISGLLVWYFKANVTALIGLYAVGVFLCFTLSQLGMVRKIHDIGGKGWFWLAAMNGVGAGVTGLVAVVIMVSKFTEGAWIVLLLVPIIVLISHLIKRHYDWFDQTMIVHPRDRNPLAMPEGTLTVLVLVSSDVHRGTLEGLECGRIFASTRPNTVFRAVHIEMDPEKTVRLRSKWKELVEPYLKRKIRLDIVPSPYRWLLEPLMEYIDQVEMERLGDRIIVVLPEFETCSVITHFLHNFTGHRLRAALLNRPNITIVSSRYFMKTCTWHPDFAETEEAVPV